MYAFTDFFPGGIIMILKNLRVAILLVVLFTLLTGLIYPFIVTGLAQLIFPGTANGSIIQKNGKAVGSELIGQPFSDPKYFWSRPSATAPYEYNAGSSTGSNYGPLNPALFDVVKKRIQDLKKADSLNIRPIPVDLVTASGSGLDPHISVAAALYQVERVARNRGMNAQEIRSLVDMYTEGRQLGFLGETRVNVLRLNLALDESQQPSKGK
jgi:K+-transporting ATPase ATPase C chain